MIFQGGSWPPPPLFPLSIRPWLHLESLFRLFFIYPFGSYAVFGVGDGLDKQTKNQRKIVHIFLPNNFNICNRLQNSKTGWCDLYFDIEFFYKSKKGG